MLHLIGSRCRSYCFVCDVPASECSRWEDPLEHQAAELSTDSTSLSIANTSHCLANDKAGPWLRIRKAGKHDWLKESPLYAHLGAQCYGASADYVVIALSAFESFSVSPKSPLPRAADSQVTDSSGCQTAKILRHLLLVHVCRADIPDRLDCSAPALSSRRSGSKVQYDEEGR